MPFGLFRNKDYRRLPHSRERLANGSDAGRVKGRARNIVESHHRDVLRHRQAEFADRGEDGFDMAVRQSSLGGEQSLGRDEGLVLEQAAEGVDFWLGRMGEVGEGALAGFVALAPAFPEEDGGGRVAVGDGLDVHEIIVSIYLSRCRFYCYLHGNILSKEE